MSTETRMAIEQSIPMPPPSESGMSVRYETKVLPLWDLEGVRRSSLLPHLSNSLDAGTKVLAELPVLKSASTLDEFSDWAHFLRENRDAPYLSFLLDNATVR
jgi:hypothetical protein